VAWRLGGALDAAALETALGEIVRRHEALRTTFAEVDGSPVQVIAPFGGFALPVEDLSGEADREAAVGRRAGEEARRPFHLSAGPLFRAALLRLGAGDHVLLLSVHHVVGDGGSQGVLYRELAALYEAYHERAASRRCRKWGCSTPTTRCGSASTSGTVSWKGSWRTGGSGSRTHPRCWSSRSSASPPAHE
jgi:NRPS condensation-like uncharacterized protein